MENQELNVSFGRIGTMSKVERYKWSLYDNPGEFKYIDKRLLAIDHNYQREKPKEHKILKISKEWSWIACGTLAVTQRDDFYFVVDGQRRKLAADKREDIKELPCLVFKLSGIKDEANSFLNLNTLRNTPFMHEKWNAMICAEDPYVLDIISSLSKTGHEISHNISSKTVCFPGALYKTWKIDQELCRVLWPVCVMAHRGEPIHGDIWLGLFYIENTLRRNNRKESITHPEYIRLLTKAGREKLLDSIAKAKMYFKRGGPKVYAEGIINILNFGRMEKNKLFLK